VSAADVVNGKQLGIAGVQVSGWRSAASFEAERNGGFFFFPQKPCKSKEDMVA
jgi:hypothetical protein